MLRALSVCLTLAALSSAVRADPLLTYPLKIRDHGLRVEVAETDEARRTGLMFRRQLGENSGMLFVYDTEQAWAMWMRNTYVPLSVAFIDRKGKIINIEDMQPQTDDTHQSAGPAKYALEVNQGWFARRGIKPGDRVLGLERIPAAK